MAPRPPAFSTRLRTAAPLIGRERLLDELWREVSTSASEGGRVAVVRGPAGIGKTRLLEEFAGRARTLGAVVVAGRSSSVGGYAYGALADALAAYVRSSAPAAGTVRRAGAPLARLVPALADPEEDAGEPPMLAVVQSAYRLVAHLTERRPMVLAVDDVHAADAETCEVLHSLVRHARQHPWTLVLGVRQPGEGGATPGRRLVESLRRDAAGCLDLELEPLDLAGTAALATAVLGEGLPSPSLVDMLHRRTDGNPYYVEEMVGWLRGAGHLQRDGLQWSAQPGSEEAVPPSIEEALAERISGLPAADRATLEWICAAGGRADLGLLAAVSDLDGPTLGASLESLAHAQLVAEEGTRTPEYRARHPLVAECVYRDMSLARRRLAHRALAFALSDRGAPAAAVATHFSRFAEVGDADAVAAALRAAADAERSLHIGRAVSWYQQALALLPDGDTPQRRQALDRLSELSVQTGQLDVGIAAAQELLALTPGDEVSHRLVLMHRLAALRGGSGQAESSRAVLEEALGLAEQGDPATARVLVELTLTASVTLSCDDVLELTRRAGAVAERYGPAARSAVLMLRGVEAWAVACAGDPQAALDASYHSALEAMASEDAVALGFQVCARAMANLQLGRFQEAADALDAMGDATEDAGLLWEATSTWALRAEALVGLGRFDDAVADALRAEDAARRHGGRETRQMAVVAGALALVHRGDLALAAERLAEARRLLDRRASNFEGDYWAAAAALAGAQGDAARAAECHARMWEWAGERSANALLNERPGHVFALLDSGDPSAALGVARSLRAALARHDLPRARALAGIALGAALIACGEVEQGVVEVERGLELRGEVDGPLLPAQALLRGGEALLAAGRRQRATELLREAHAELAAIGAVWLRDRAAAALRAAGVAVPAARGGRPAGFAAASSPARAGAAAGMRFGVLAGGAADEADAVPAQTAGPLDALSARELDVARLAAAGLRSRAVGVRLGISERTVENHLASAYAKLGVHSRAELIALLGEASRQTG